MPRGKPWTPEEDALIQAAVERCRTRGCTMAQPPARRLRGVLRWMPFRLLAAVLALALLNSCSSDDSSPAGPSSFPTPGDGATAAGAPRRAAAPGAGENGVVAAFDGPVVRGATMGYSTMNVYVTAEDGALAVSWDAVPEATSYRVRTTVLESGAVVHEVELRRSALTIGPLNNGVDYYVTVTALYGDTGFEIAAGANTAAPVGAAGNSTPAPAPPWTPAPVPPPAPGGVPGQVTGVKVYPHDGALRVVWSAVPGRVSQYRVDANAPDGTLARRAYTSGDTSTTLGGLVNGVTYSVTVRATNGGDWGAASVPEPGWPGGWPGVSLGELVPNVRVVVSGSTIQVSWGEVSGVDGYFVYAVPHASRDSRLNRTARVKGFSKQFHSLPIGEYSVGVHTVRDTVRGEVNYGPSSGYRHVFVCGVNETLWPEYPACRSLIEAAAQRGR